MEQDPSAGVEVGTGTPVNLVVSSGPEEVTLPDLTTLSERDATTQLAELGLKWLVEEEFDSAVPSGDVISTDPAAGEAVLSGDTITLKVSLGPQPVEVPNLFGLTPGEAQVILEDLGLTLNVSNSTQPVADEGQDGTIVNQIPGAGINALPGDIVTVTLGEFVPPPTTTTTLPPTTTTLPPGSTTEA